MTIRIYVRASTKDQDAENIVSKRSKNPQNIEF